MIINISKQQANSGIQKELHAGVGNIRVRNMYSDSRLRRKIKECAGVQQVKQLNRITLNITIWYSSNYGHSNVFKIKSI